MGLVQRVIKEAGISTICINNMVPDYSRASGFPRVAALEYPFSLTLGRPGDREGQLQVIRAALRALVEIQARGGIVHLPFAWPEDPATVDMHPPEPSPIAKLIRQGHVQDPVVVLGQRKWRNVAAILRKGRTPAAAADECRI